MQLKQINDVPSPIGPSDCHGVDIYTRTLEFVVQKIALCQWYRNKTIINEDNYEYKVITCIIIV